MERIRIIERCFGSDNKVCLKKQNWRLDCLFYIKKTGFIWILKEILARPGRALVGEGVLIKECRKKPKPRYFFLFNDILVYGTSVINKKKYINQHIIPLNNLQIKSINDSSNPSWFTALIRLDSCLIDSFEFFKIVY